MKNKIGFIIAGASILLIAFASLGISRTQQGAEIEKLQNDLTLAKRRLVAINEQPLVDRKADLEKLVVRTQAELDATKSNLRQNLADIPVTESLFKLAFDYNVKITAVGTPGKAADPLSGIPCQNLPLTVTVCGEIPDILNFIEAVGVTYSTGMIKNVTFSVQQALLAPTILPVPETITVPVTTYSAVVQFKIYSYEGS